MFENIQGKRAFDSCAVKVILFKDMVYKCGDDGEMIPSTNPSEGSRTFAGNGAVLRCPKTEDDDLKIESQYSNHPSRQAALTSVRKLAGPLLCRNCPYSGMTRAEVAHERAEFARAEADRLQATMARDLALKQLEAQTGQSYLGLLEQSRSESS